MMSIYIGIKLVAVGNCIYFVLKKWFPQHSVSLRMGLSLLYVFCIFNIQYYYAPMWLELSFLFPLIMYGYFRLIREGKPIIYIVSLGFAFMTSFQHSYMLTLFIVLLTGIFGVIYKREIYGKLGHLILSSLLGVMLSSWIFLPGSIQILNANRIRGGSRYLIFGTLFMCFILQNG